eukprot:6325688-Pyramimonas_sp.AAC.1
MAEQVDPAGEAPEKGASRSIPTRAPLPQTSLTMRGASIDLRCVVAETMGLSLGRRVAYRAGAGGWARATVDRGL